MSTRSTTIEVSRVLLAWLMARTAESFLPDPMPLPSPVLSYAALLALARILFSAGLLIWSVVLVVQWLRATWAKP